MPSPDLELILLRQLAEHLVTPIFVVDPDGTLLYYNEPAEALLGKRFDETGAMPAAEWSTVFTPTDEDGTPLPPESLPLVAALASRIPAHRRFWIDGLDRVRRCIDVTALPLIGIGDRLVGAAAIFWEAPHGSHDGHAGTVPIPAAAAPFSR